MASRGASEQAVARWIGAGVGILAGSLFASTHSAAIQVADSGEVVAAACKLGVAHPPGYPLYTLLGHLACQLPWTTPAGRVGLVSLVAGILAVLALYGVVRRLTQSLWAAATAAMILATGSLFWRYASLAEVFALHLALGLGLVYAVVRSIEGASPASGPAFGPASGPLPGAASGPLSGGARSRWVWLAIASLLFGLGLSNHLSIVFLGPLLILPLVRPWPGTWRAIGLALLALLALGLGLAPYGQLLWADPAALPRWGNTNDLAGFLHHVLRRDYGTLRLSLGGGGGPLAAPRLLAAELPRQLGWVLSPLALWGLVLLGARGSGRPLGRLFPGTIRRDLAVALLVAPILLGPLFLLLFNIPTEGIGRQVVERFFLLPIALFTLPLGIGLAALDRGVARVGGDRRRLIWRGLVWTVIALVALASYVRADVSENFAVEDYAVNALVTAEPGAMIVGLGDVHLFSMIYAQRVLGIRRDVQYVDAKLLGYRWYVDQQRRLYPGFAYRFTPGRMDSLRLIQGAQRRGRTVYLTSYYNQRVRLAFASFPDGPLLHVVDPRRSPPRFVDVLRLNERLFRRFRRRGRAPDPLVDPWSASLREPFAVTWRALGRELERRGSRTLARRAYRRGALWAPWMPLPSWVSTSAGLGGTIRRHLRDTAR